MIDREQIADAARGWVGTPFQHQQRERGVAVDCAGLVIGVARELGLVEPSFDVNGYSRLPDGQTLLEHCRRWMREVARDAMSVGDVLVVRFDREPQHFGFLVDYRHGGLAIVHAATKYGRVVETRLLFGTSPRSMKFVAAFALPGVD